MSEFRVGDRVILRDDHGSTHGPYTVSEVGRNFIGHQIVRLAGIGDTWFFASSFDLVGEPMFTLCEMED